MIKRRAILPELAWVQICSEAGDSTKHHPRVNSLAIPGVSPADERELDLFVGRLPIFGGKTVLGDVTLRSPLTAEGAPKNGAHREAGSTFHTARLDKARAHPELMSAESRFQFLVLACEVGGHLSEECHTLIGQLVTYKAASSPDHLRRFVKGMFRRRWYGLWCAALSSAVSRGGPEGQLPGFNANVLFKNIPVPYVIGVMFSFKIQHLQQHPQYLKLEIHAAQMPKCFCKPFKLWGFWSHMWSIFVNFQKMPKL